MMNDLDIMLIYPMHEIEVDRQHYSMSNPLLVTHNSASVIRNIYTPAPYGTPVESIRAASVCLQSVTADEKWLIVMAEEEKKVEFSTIPL
jgi:hypothetical protein